jgi:hypothetical protein
MIGGGVLNFGQIFGPVAAGMLMALWSAHPLVGATKAFGTGGKGIRTPGLLIANETLYQLSYTPVVGQRS